MEGHLWGAQGENCGLLHERQATSVPPALVQRGRCQQKGKCHWVHGKLFPCDLGEREALSQGVLTFRGQLGGVTVGGFLVYISSETPQKLQAATAGLDARSAFSIPTIQQVKQ